MKVEMKIGRLRSFSLTLLVTLVLQCGAAVWWVSAKARDTVFLEQRVVNIETVLSNTTESTAKICERLARIEERVKAQMVLLNRIDKKTSFHQP
ncbi:MAG TPA: hypothetical protein DD400_03920 [Rhodospirillaceae bacterium]|nr:hypothetical protein [Rhodospirillaceae bacterium]